MAAMDFEFPVLEFLCIMPSTEWNHLWTLPTTFQAPCLRYLILTGSTSPIRSRSRITGVGLVALNLESFEPSADFSPNALLERLSLMPHLQSFAIHFSIPLPDNDVNEQPLNIRHVTLPNLHPFAFQGESVHLVALLPHITTPLLKKLYIRLLDQHTFASLSVPHILQFVITTENFTGLFSSAVLRVNIWDISVVLYPDAEARMYSLCLYIHHPYSDRQVEFTAHYLDILRPILSEVMHLILEYPEDITSAESARWHDQQDRIYWRKVLGAFRNVKTVSMHKGLVEKVSRSLRLDGGQSSVDLLPELNKLECYGSGNACDEFAPFIDTRKNAGRPVTLIRFGNFPIRKHRRKSIRPTVPDPFQCYLSV